MSDRKWSGLVILIGALGLVIVMFGGGIYMVAREMCRQRDWPEATSFVVKKRLRVSSNRYYHCAACYYKFWLPKGTKLRRLDRGWSQCVEVPPVKYALAVIRGSRLPVATEGEIVWLEVGHFRNHCEEDATSSNE